MTSLGEEATLGRVTFLGRFGISDVGSSYQSSQSGEALYSLIEPGRRIALAAGGGMLHEAEGVNVLLAASGITEATFNDRLADHCSHQRIQSLHVRLRNRHEHRRRLGQVGYRDDPGHVEGLTGPSTGCDVPTDLGSKAFMPYTADYFFFTQNWNAHF